MTPEAIVSDVSWTAVITPTTVHIIGRRKTRPLTTWCGRKPLGGIYGCRRTSEITCGSCRRAFELGPSSGPLRPCRSGRPNTPPGPPAGHTPQQWPPRLG